MRWLVAVLLGAILMAAMPVGGGDADAAAKKEKSKACTVTGLDNKKVSWKCKASEKCCYDWITSKGTCVAASAICL
ncbi:MAG TPA: hypothetical protein VNK52_06695 [Hyphomicrobiaceae bacterium]|nr:hypothetical protein [Hyphomicrobiaceae bacterium]